MDFIGLDIGEHILRGVELKRAKNGKRELVRYAQSPSGGISLESESTLDLEALSGSLDSFVSRSGFGSRNVVAALPESQVFTRVITVPKMSVKELGEAMKWEAEQYIPIPLSEVSFDYQVIGDSPDKNKMDVLLVAAPLTLSQKYLRVISGAHLRVVGLETVSIAIARSLIGQSRGSPPTMLVNIGSATTDISVIAEGSIRFTRSISSGGDSLIRAVAQRLEFDSERAKEYLRSYGLEEAALEGAVVASIKPVFDVIVSEIRRSLAYYATHERDRPQIERLILSGESADLPGVLVFLAAAVNLEVQLADPWEGIVVPKNIDAEKLTEVGPEFAVAVGLALKDI